MIGTIVILSLALLITGGLAWFFYLTGQTNYKLYEDAYQRKRSLENQIGGIELSNRDYRGTIEDLKEKLEKGDLLKDLIRAQTIRSDAMYGGVNFSLVYWTNALCGESGEIANLSKKCHRDAINIEEMKEEFEGELADAFTYLLFIADYLEIDLLQAYISKFNIVSDRKAAPYYLRKENGTVVLRSELQDGSWGSNANQVKGSPDRGSTLSESFAYRR